MIRYRIFQKALFLASFFLPWRTPTLLSGENSLNQIGDILSTHKKSRPLVVTDKMAIERNALKPLFLSLDSKNIAYTIFDGVLPNPTIDQIEEGRELYQKNACDSIIAFGGGSVLDCAKAIGARIARPKKSIPQMKGLLKVRKKLPLLFAIPTTAGTGSEVTLAAVVTDSKTHQKYAISDHSLIPHFAILDPNLTVDLPPNLTATTGMDALTHAVEAFLGNSNTKATKQQAKKAVKLVFNNLPQAVENGKDLTARANMQYAAFLAGQAFTRAYVGYVHALAHALGGKYGVPHGLANAILLPVVLLAYQKSAHKKLAILAEEIGLTGETAEEKALAFISAILELNEKINIPNTLPQSFGAKPSDFEEMAKNAIAEANPLYPVPRIFTKEDLIALYGEVV